MSSLQKICPFKKVHMRLESKKLTFKDSQILNQNRLLTFSYTIIYDFLPSQTFMKCPFFVDIVCLAYR